MYLSIDYYVVKYKLQTLQPTTLVATGTLTTGSKIITALNPIAGGYRFIGNPFQSQVNLQMVMTDTTNLNKTFITFEYKKQPFLTR